MQIAATAPLKPLFCCGGLGAPGSGLCRGLGAFAKQSLGDLASRLLQTAAGAGLAVPSVSLGAGAALLKGFAALSFVGSTGMGLGQGQG